MCVASDLRTVRREDVELLLLSEMSKGLSVLLNPYVILHVSLTTRIPEMLGRFLNLNTI